MASSADAALASLTPLARTIAVKFAFRSGGALTADDLTQVALIAAHRAMSNAAEPLPAHTLGATMRNAVIDHARSELHLGHPTAHVMQPWCEGHDPADSAPGPEQITHTRQRARLVVQAMAALTERQRELLRAVYDDDTPRSDLAERWGLHPSRISQMHAEAIAALRRAVTSATHKEPAQ